MIKAAILGSVMIIFVLLARFTLAKKIPRGCFRLMWMLVAIRLLFPFSFIVKIDMPLENSTYVSEQNSVAFNAYEYVDGKYEAEYEAHIDSTLIIHNLYLLGTAVCSGFMIFAYIRLRRLALRGTPPPKEVINKWGRLCILCGDGFETAFSSGILKPVVFIPNNMLKLDSKQLDAVIIHEQQHIRRGDQLFKILLCASACVHWYNPLVWVMLHYANRDIELACDESVIRCIGEKKNYALTLIAAEETRCTATICSFGAPVLNERIEYIMNSKKVTICGFVAAGVLLALMTVFFVSVSASNIDKEIDNSFISPSHDVENTADININGNATENIVEDNTIVSDPAVYDKKTYADVAEFICPLDSFKNITGKFGTQTNPMGVSVIKTDINVAAEKYSTVYASASGNVICAEFDNKYGNIVKIDHGNGYITTYSYCSELIVKKDDYVEAGQKIATVGSTGMVTGPNLGFAISCNGEYLDPTSLFE